jgi:Zn-finger nucleic acid-binding protein
MAAENPKDTRTCDHCGKEINRGFRICPLCGGQSPDRLEDLPPVCPRCKSDLAVHEHDGMEYDLCPRCGGMWLDRGEFKRATRESDVYRKEKLDQDYVRTPPADPVAYIPCVRCGQTMTRKNFGRISGVIIDECVHHGVWLDAGELEKIRLFIVDGGLESAQDRELEENRVELRRLATKLDQTAFSHKLIHYWNPKRWLFGG